MVHAVRLLKTEFVFVRVIPSVRVIKGGAGPPSFVAPWRLRGATRPFPAKRRRRGSIPHRLVAVIVAFVAVKTVS